MLADLSVYVIWKFIYLNNKNVLSFEFDNTFSLVSLDVGNKPPVLPGDNKKSGATIERASLM